MADRPPRPSTDDDTAPLLQGDDELEALNGDQQPAQPKSFTETLDAIVSEPLTPLTKILLVLVLFLLLLTSVFIGLFAGAQHKLNDRGHPGDPIPTTIVSTSTVIQTSTAVETTVQPGPTQPPGVPKGPKYCDTPNCIMLSAQILHSLDQTADPCEDFYQFATGGWSEDNMIPTGKSELSSFAKLSQENKRIIQKLLETEPVPSTSAPSTDELVLGKLRGMYNSCMNEDLLNERGQQPLLDIVNVIRHLYHGYSLDIDNEKTQVHLDAEKGMKPTLNNQTSLTATVVYLHTRGIDSLFNFEIEGDIGDDPSFMSLWFYQPSLGLPAKEYYKEKDIVSLYEATLARILEALAEEEEKSMADQTWPPWPWPPWGDDDDDDGHKKKENKTQKAHRLSKEIVKFERKIANASLDLDELQLDPIGTYNPVSFDEFAEQVPQIFFPAYFAAFTPRNFPNRVIMPSKTYASDLSKILEETEKETLEAYFVTRVALQLASYLGTSTEVWQAKRAMDETLRGIKKGQVPDRADTCVQVVEDTLGFAAGRYFVNETFGGDSKDKATKVIEDVISMFKESVAQVTWMDEKSSKAAQEKADAIGVKVGYPTSPDTKNPRSLYNYYARVSTDPNTLFENVVSAAANDEFMKWQQLGKQRNPGSWEMYPSMVNAYFNPPANEIVFPAGILRPPFFSAEWPSYLQFGAFGHVAAHELTHAFDSAGRMYNQNGKLEQWWTNATSERYNVKQKCIADQYSKYAVDDGKGGKEYVNANLTSGENIADNGFIIPYRAWKAQYESSLQAGNEYLLPGLDFTPEQLLFIAFGQIWAQNIKPATAVQRVRTDPHSPNKYRVEGTLYNLPEFAKAFNCSSKAKMNPPPEKQCRLW